MPDSGLGTGGRFCPGSHALAVAPGVLTPTLPQLVLVPTLPRGNPHWDAPASSSPVRVRAPGDQPHWTQERPIARSHAGAWERGNGAWERGSVGVWERSVGMRERSVGRRDERRPMPLAGRSPPTRNRDLRSRCFACPVAACRACSGSRWPFCRYAPLCRFVSIC